MSEPSVLEALRQRLAGVEPTVAVIGLGYVGLPLALELVRAGTRVLGIDVSETRCETINAGASPVGDITDAELSAALATGRLTSTTDYDVAASADAVVICVPTPLRKSKDPDISYIVASATALAQRARPGQLVVLESTTYPGTTEELLVPMLQKQGLEPGIDVAVAFSPERIDPGNPTFGVRNTPKVVGGVTPACTAAAAALYGRCCDHIVPVSSPATAEMSKLLENIFRSVNIGLANEFALICHRLELDVWEVIDAAATKPFGFMAFRPGPGLGGHCIPIDPHYLTWKLRSRNFTARFVELADAINSRMPEHVLSVVSDALNDRAKAVRGSKVLILGVTYKPNVADLRESPALAVIDLLLAKGADVSFHDPFVSSVKVAGQTFEGVELGDDSLGDADCVLITTDHQDYDFPRIVARATLVVDTRNATSAVLADTPELGEKVYRI